MSALGSRAVLKLTGQRGQARSKQPEGSWRAGGQNQKGRGGAINCPLACKGPRFAEMSAWGWALEEVDENVWGSRC